MTYQLSGLNSEPIGTNTNNATSRPLKTKDVLIINITNCQTGMISGGISARVTNAGGQVTLVEVAQVHLEIRSSSRWILWSFSPLLASDTLSKSFGAYGKII